ncbi:MAG: fibronectin type III domain-containing protein [Ruminococcus sp.]|nr:fibronectin type III domain-containing protein [Ruminococcus sp.]
MNVTKILALFSAALIMSNSVTASCVCADQDDYEILPDTVYAPPNSDEPDYFYWFPWESTDTTVTLHWHINTVDNKAKGYLERMVEENVWEKVPGYKYTNKEAITIKNLKPGTAPYFRWHFTYINLTSGIENDWNTGEIRTHTKPSAPKVTEVHVGRKSVRLEWKRLKYLSGYKVQCYDNTNKKWVTKATIWDSKNNGSAKIKKLEPGKKYKFRIKAFTQKTSQRYSSRAKWNEKKRRYDTYKTVWGIPTTPIIITTKL